MPVRLRGRRQCMRCISARPLGSTDMKFIALVFSCLFTFSIPASADDVDLFNAMLALATQGITELVAEQHRVLALT